MAKRRALVVGAGIVGLAMARALAAKHCQVTVLEGQGRAVGASIRNFGMIWPIGQPAGHMLERALRSRSVWKEFCSNTGCWYEEAGSLHLARSADEVRVLQEFYEIERPARNISWLSAREITRLSPVAKQEGLLGGLLGRDDIIIDPREAIPALAEWLMVQQELEFHWDQQVVEASAGNVRTSDGKLWEADLVFICTGADTGRLYPEIMRRLPIVSCKLQMMRFVAQPEGMRIGPALCGGLSLLHYKSFQSAPSLPLYRKLINDNMPEYMQWGIHVMAAQNGKGELTIGDSHEYGNTTDPFDKQEINQLILDYLFGFARFPREMITESWHGTYIKTTDGSKEVFISPEPGVYIVNGLGGAGMTLSFGLAEELVTDIL